MANQQATGDPGVSAEIPGPLAEIIAEFQALQDRARLQLLLEYSRRLPELPAAFQDSFEQMDEIVECQSPLFLAAEFDDDAATAQIFFAAPQEVPTTRGFASILQHGLSGQPYSAILATPNDVAQRLGLSRVIAPMRLSAVGTICARVRGKVAEHLNND